MSEVNNDYLVFEQPRKSLKPGINEGVVIKEIKYEMQPTFECCSITYAQGEIEMTDKIFPVNDAHLYPYPNETEEQAKKRRLGEMNSKLQSIILNYTDKETFIERMTKARPSTFKEAIDVYISLLPANYNTVEGRLFVWYKDNGFLEVPKKVNYLKGKKVFTVNPADDLTIFNKANESRLIRPAQEGDQSNSNVPAAPPAENAPW